jgi:hypothetical protein
MRAREKTMFRSFNPSSLSALCALAVLSLPAAAALADENVQSTPLIEKVRHATA